MPTGEDRVVDPDELRAEYSRYDRCVDIVSTCEMWFTLAKRMQDTVRHFERFPRVAHPDGEPATPDFTVLFRDGTAYVGELSNLSLHRGSLDSLSRQLLRYEQLPIPDGRGGTVTPTAIDVLLFVPHAEANAAARRLARAASDPDHSYSPARLPSVFAWSFDSARKRYVFTLAAGSSNVAPRGHGRDPTLASWMDNELSPETLIGPARHFGPVKVARRLINDRPPPLYLATLLWSVVLPRINGGSGDVRITTAELVDHLQQSYGRGRTDEVHSALTFLEAGGLARRSGDIWLIGHTSIARHDDDLAETLLRRHGARPSGPATSGERDQAAARRAQQDLDAQRQLSFEDDLH